MDGNGRSLEPSKTPDFVGYEWERGGSLAAELGVKVLRVADRIATATLLEGWFAKFGEATDLSCSPSLKSWTL